MRWQGFRRVRKQVCKRIQRRIARLKLQDVQAYREFLEATPREWQVLDGLVRVVVTRFYRDRKVFDELYRTLIPLRLKALRSKGVNKLRIWSIGCASGEEPYTLSLLWQHLPVEITRGMELEILATDSDAHLLHRAANACYPYGAIKALPKEWQEKDFEPRGGEFCLREKFKQAVKFELHDIRQPFTFGRFDLLFCRNLTFTYFDEARQMASLKSLHEALDTDGLLVIGGREVLPAGQGYFEALQGCRGIYRRR